MKQITCGKHELDGKNPGDTVTVTNYVTARVGSGMDPVGQVTGRLVSVDDPTVRCHGCSFVWSDVTIDVAVRSTDRLGIGEILPKKSMILRQHIGEAKQGKLEYEMSTAIAGMPIIHSKQTGKWFTLSWKTILELAVKAGIDA